ncbi:M20/M25/M40 family metallo-hydrolase [Curtobacterium sp. MCSS17_005]|uniref:M20/M25/M40 family metallo-hydrolase n=1 Tax=Curtobacterium sp. MCSS17_005 TaxID=2175641 RepID=UPI000DA7FB22|nr:M20/M25/M40 family metallo-hydrolase [Curtobacterium sp. MCSS17_005]WIB31366.1 M20/M25/M40 family metallo-hydrolase [Curtobacterium sp. MCSS17_005]
MTNPEPSEPQSVPELEATAAIARDLIRIDTTNWGEGKSRGETEAAHYVEDKLRALGLEPQLFESEPDRVSVVARVPGRNRDEPALVVHGHLDVVPADPANWSVDPFGGVVKDGSLWGRGAVDMKNMDAMMLTSLADVIEQHGAPERDLVIAYFADEEAGGVLGSHHVVDQHPEVFAGASAAISEVGGYSITLGDRRAYLLQTGEKALMWVKLIARGTAAHGSHVIRDNAVTKLAAAVARIGSEEWPVRLSATTDAMVAEVARFLGVDPTVTGPDEVALATGSASRFIHAALHTTSNPTVLTAGYKHNVIPDTAEALVDIRCLPGDEETVLERVRELAGPDVEVVMSFRDIGLEQDFGGPLVDAVRDVLGRHDPGAPVLPYLLSGGTDNKALSTLGIAGYGFVPLQLPAGVDFPAMFHGVDERVPLDSLAFGRRVLGDLLATY